MEPLGDGVRLTLIREKNQKSRLLDVVVKLREEDEESGMGYSAKRLFSIIDLMMQILMAVDQLHFNKQVLYNMSLENIGMKN